MQLFVNLQAFLILEMIVGRLASHMLNIACVGDSITYGYGASDVLETSYPAVLSKIFGGIKEVNIHNFGIPGATMLKHGKYVFPLVMMK